MSKPITPAQIGQGKASVFPAAVFDAFNAEILAQFAGGKADVAQHRVVDRLKAGGMSSREIFDNGYLNVEEAYRSAGWKVRYEKPGYNESGEPFFYFTTDGGSEHG